MITVLGEAVVRLAQTSDETTVRALPDGSGLNIAIAAARLGYPAALMARLSGDAFGQLLRRHAARNGVNLSAAPDADEPTTIAERRPGSWLLVPPECPGPSSRKSVSV